jgi:hypothetical protein
MSSFMKLLLLCGVCLGMISAASATWGGVRFYRCGNKHWQSILCVSHDRTRSVRRPHRQSGDHGR